MSGLKMFFVCDGDRDWWTCFGVLSNGFCFGQHICSSPIFAPGDLYFRRSERIEGLKEIFNINPETVEVRPWLYVARPTSPNGGPDTVLCKMV